MIPNSDNYSVSQATEDLQEVQPRQSNTPLPRSYSSTGVEQVVKYKKIQWSICSFCWSSWI